MNPTETAALKPEIVEQTQTLPATTGPTAVAAPTPDTYFRGVPPEDKLNRMYGFSKAIANATFISPVIRGDVASTFFLVNMGEDMGLQWTHALRSLYPLKKAGRDGGPDQITVGIQGDVALALLLSKKFKVKITESTEEKATVWMARPDGSMEFEDSMTIQEARALGLTTKNNWKYPKDMLRWRALMRVARLVAADVLGGLYLPDEIESIEDAPSSPRPEPPNPYYVTTSNDTQEPAMASAASESPATDSGLGEAAASAVTPQVGFLGAPVVTAQEVRLPPRPDKPLKMIPQTPYDLACATLLEEFPNNEQLVNMQTGFLRGFTNLTKIPKNHADIIPATILMASMCAAHKATIIQDPKAAGLQSGVGWKALMALIAAWPEDCQGIAKSIAIERYPENPQFLVDYLNEVAEMHTMDEADGRAFLLVLGRTRKAVLLKDAAAARGVSLAAELTALGLNLATCSEQELIEALITKEKYDADNK